MIPRDYFIYNDTLWLAKDLLGKYLFCNTGNQGMSGGIITETEAYLGAIDKASHAWNNRRTQRTETLFQGGGIAYVYLCYGMHHLFNIVTNQPEIPHAILIRAVKITHPPQRPLAKGSKNLPLHFNGPGKLTKALGITTRDNATPLDADIIWLEDRQLNIPPQHILTGPRIGVDYAGDDALLPWRFWVKEDFVASL
jgi:DNA-3-methyladenine glycosylase